MRTVQSAIYCYKQEHYSDAKQTLRQLAESGNYEAMLYLGIISTEGITEARDDSLALEYLRKAAENTDNPVAFIEYSALLDNYGGDDNTLLSTYWFGKARERLAQLKKMAEQGNPFAQIALSYFYAHTSDPYHEGQFYWARRASTNNHPQGLYHLAKMYDEGIATKLSPKQEKAHELMTAAYNKGLVWAETELGLDYYLGEGVDKDKRKARAFFESASSKGSLLSTYYLLTFLLTDEPAYTEEKLKKLAQRLIDSDRRRFAREGHYELMKLLLDERGGESRNDHGREVIKHLAAAAALGHQEAAVTYYRYTIASLTAAGGSQTGQSDIEETAARAHEYLQENANSGNNQAKYVLAKSYLEEKQEVLARLGADQATKRQGLNAMRELAADDYSEAVRYLAFRQMTLGGVADAIGAASGVGKAWNAVKWVFFYPGNAAVYILDVKVSREPSHPVPYDGVLAGILSALVWIVLLAGLAQVE